MVSVGLDNVAFDWVEKFFIEKKLLFLRCTIFYLIITQQLNINGNSNEAEKNNSNEKRSSRNWGNAVSYDLKKKVLFRDFSRSHVFETWLRNNDFIGTYALRLRYNLTTHFSHKLRPLGNVNLYQRRLEFTWIEAMNATTFSEMRLFFSETFVLLKPFFLSMNFKWMN